MIFAGGAGHVYTVFHNFINYFSEYIESNALNLHDDIYEIQEALGGEASFKDSDMHT